MFGIPIEDIILSSSYLGVFFLMIANGFISFPSSQILYIIVGYFVSIGTLNLIVVSFLGTLGNTIGNIILYELSRSRGIAYITRFKIFPEKEVKKIEIAFNRKGAWFLFIGKLLPAIKVFVPIPAGVAKMHRGLYLLIIFAASYIWALVFIGIGYYFGKSKDVFGKYSVALSIVAFIVLYGFYKYMNSKEVIEEVEK